MTQTSDQSAPTTTPAPPQNPVLAPAKVEEYNRTHLDFHRPIPRPPVEGAVIDFHNHLLKAAHAPIWFETGSHYGFDKYVTMTQLEEAQLLHRDYPDRVHFIAVPKWGALDMDDWMRRIEGFYELGSRMIKFHMAPGTMVMRNYRLDSPQLAPILQFARDRKMIIMTHMGDPETWYQGKYADTAKFGTRNEHYKMWESVIAEYPYSWVGAHMGGNPEDLARLQYLLDTYPRLSLDCSATRWMQRTISDQRDAAREFFIRNQDRLIFGSDQVSGDDRGFDFLASRWWVHRKLWETAYIGPSPIIDPDLDNEHQPTLRGLALPSEVLQKIYRDNAVKLLKQVDIAL
ncbi:MAG TPA: amidohydrolase family protein [Tepidisphaeraceae bacterium]|jgi:predicted TIM-barrel fold metal-dependent hydrolase